MAGRSMDVDSSRLMRVKADKRTMPSVTNAIPRAQMHCFNVKAATVTLRKKMWSTPMSTPGLERETSSLEVISLENAQ